MNERDVTALKRRIRSLYNDQLRAICRSLFIQVSGTKPILQNRIFTFLDRAVANGDVLEVEVLRYRAENNGRSPPPAHMQRLEAQVLAATNLQPTPAQSPARDALAHSQNAVRNKIAKQTSLLPQASSACTLIAGDVSYFHREGEVFFKKSPFFTLESSLSPGVTAKAIPAAGEHTRQFTFSLTLDHTLASAIRSGQARVLFFSARDPVSYGPSDLGFPTTFRISVDRTQVPADVRGLKGKPDSIVPVNLTDHLNPNGMKPHQISVVYSPSRTSLFYFRLFVARPHTAVQLAESILAKNHISKEAVVAEIQANNNDPDITAMQVNMSLSDPLTMSRMTVPCRGLSCKHYQCFDGETFLELQEQSPNWQCPICSKSIRFDEILVDGYMLDILRSTDEQCENVTIEPDGTWRVSDVEEEDVDILDSDSDESDDGDVPRRNEAEPPRATAMPAARDEQNQEADAVQGGNVVADSDSDIIEVVEPASARDAPGQSARAPPARVAQAVPSLPQPSPVTGEKRSRPVIDLTLSDSEDEDNSEDRPQARRTRPRLEHSERELPAAVATRNTLLRPILPRAAAIAEPKSCPTPASEPSSTTGTTISPMNAGPANGRPAARLDGPDVYTARNGSHLNTANSRPFVAQSVGVASQGLVAGRNGSVLPPLAVNGRTSSTGLAISPRVNSEADKGPGRAAAATFGSRASSEVSIWDTLAANPSIEDPARDGDDPTFLFLPSTRNSQERLTRPAAPSADNCGPSTLPVQARTPGSENVHDAFIHFAMQFGAQEMVQEKRSPSLRHAQVGQAGHVLSGSIAPRTAPLGATRGNRYWPVPEPGLSRQMMSSPLMPSKSLAAAGRPELPAKSYNTNSVPDLGTGERISKSLYAGLVNERVLLPDDGGKRTGKFNVLNLLERMNRMLGVVIRPALSTLPALEVDRADRESVGVIRKLIFDEVYLIPDWPFEPERKLSSWAEVRSAQRSTDALDTDPSVFYDGARLRSLIEWAARAESPERGLLVSTLGLYYLDAAAHAMNRQTTTTAQARVVPDEAFVAMYLFERIVE